MPSGFYPDQAPMTVQDVDGRVAALSPGMAPVQSVNGATGDVTVTSAGLGAASASHTHPASDVTSGRFSMSRLPDGVTMGAPLRSWGSSADPSYSMMPMRVPFVSAAPATWTLMPSALTEFLGGVLYRNVAGLSGFVRFRVSGHVLVAGATNAVIRLRYSTNAGGAWSNCGTSSSDMPLVSTGAVFGAWEDLAVGARADVVIAPWGSSGNGVLSPVLGSLVAEFC